MGPVLDYKRGLSPLGVIIGKPLLPYPPTMSSPSYNSNVLGRGPAVTAAEHIAMRGDGSRTSSANIFYQGGPWHGNRIITRFDRCVEALYL